ncbi:Uncharacterised protein [Bacillus freudenreichii]|nr:Uncharacterised protein [Bacillus freudenreichii]
MKWGAFFATLVIVAVIFLLQWPKMKKNPKKDKIVFIVLLSLGLVLSMFDLQRIPGPVTWVTTILRPLGKFLEL